MKLLIIPFLALFMLVSPASAEYIQLTPSVTVPTVILDNSANLTVSIINTGDEVAKNIRVELNLPDGIKGDVIIIGDIQPQQTKEETVTLFIGDNLRGSYPAILKIKYSDLNGYEFSALTSSILRIGESAYSEISVKAEPTIVPEDGGAEMVFELVNNEEVDIVGTIKLRLSNEFTVDIIEKQVNLPSKKREIIYFEIENFLGLDGSTYPSILTIEYEKDGLHYTHISSSVIEIIGGNRNKYLIGTTISVVILAYVIYRRYRG